MFPFRDVEAQHSCSKTFSMLEYIAWRGGLPQRLKASPFSLIHHKILEAPERIYAGPPSGCGPSWKFVFLVQVIATEEQWRTSVSNLLDSTFWSFSSQKAILSHCRLSLKNKDSFASERGTVTSDCKASGMIYTPKKLFHA